MTDLDLSGINPLNWERARARARAVQEYVALPKKSGVERDRLAATLGISPNLFSRLVAAWRGGRGTEALMASGKPKPRRDNRLPERTKAIMASAITLHGADASSSDIKRAIMARCAAEGVPAPCNSTIHVHQRKAYRGLQAANAGAAIVVGELLVNLPCTTADGTIVRPKVLVAVDLARRHVIGFRTVPNSAKADYAGLIAEVRRIRPAGTIAAEASVAAYFSDGAVATLGISFEGRGSVGKRLCRTFGARLDDLPVIYRPAAAACPRQLLARNGGRAITFEMAFAAVTLAIGQHNRKWPLGGAEIKAAA